MNLHILFSANAHKEYSSMRLIGVATSQEELCRMIRECDKIDYPSNLEEISLDQINNHISYAYVFTDITPDTIL